MVQIRHASVGFKGAIKSLINSDQSRTSVDIFTSCPIRGQSPGKRASQQLIDVIGVNQTVCKELYGFSSFDFLIDFVEAAFDIEYTKPQHATVGAGGSGEGGLSDFEQVLLTLVFTNTLWNYDMIGLLFGIT
jgi:hypothetical protein